MYQNSYQNGHYLDLLDPKLSQDKLKPLYRTTNVQGNYKVFDKELKTFIFQFLCGGAKIFMPREQKKDLYLIQQYLVLQIYFFQGFSWNIELTISDLTKTKRRIIISPATHKIEVKPFFAKVPTIAEDGIWMNYAIDLYSYINLFKGQTYRSLDGININGGFKLRRIYTSSEAFGNEEDKNKSMSLLPKNLCFPQGIEWINKINKYDNENQQQYRTTEPSTKNSSFLKGSRSKGYVVQYKGQIVKRQKIDQVNRQLDVQEKYNKKLQEKEIQESWRQKQLVKKERQVQIGCNLKKTPNQRQLAVRREKSRQIKRIKDFFSNTDEGQRAGKHKKTEQKKSNHAEYASNKAKSNEKYGKGKKMIKTQEMAGKVRLNISRKDCSPKVKDKMKINPWKTKEVAQTDLEYEGSKIQSRPSAVTSQMFNNRGTTTPQYSQQKPSGFDRRSDNYSDSEYFELSQKFSTLMQGKFFRHQSIMPNQQNQCFRGKEQEQQIQQNIEMESDSMYSSHHQNQQKIKIEPSQEDSLDPHHNNEQIFRSSLYGFGEKLMRQFMGQKQRPYSPPMGQRQGTESSTSNLDGYDKEEVELIYDPVLNCYYDHRTHTYYELKN